jgi:hypothetical protein
MGVTFRFLQPDEASKLTNAMRLAYGDSYDVRWVYDEVEVARRLAAATYRSCVAETPGGELLCHEGMSLSDPGDMVGHSGQAVTMPAARGQHIFTRTKRFLMDWARKRGMAGMYSEATAAHPYSQRANIDLGAHETGFLLGWIPASVANDAAAGERRGRQSAALFYAKLNDGHERAVYAPERHRAIVGQTLALCELHGERTPTASRCKRGSGALLRKPSQQIVNGASERGPRASGWRAPDPSPTACSGRREARRWTEGPGHPSPGSFGSTHRSLKATQLRDGFLGGVPRSLNRQRSLRARRKWLEGFLADLP